MKVLMSDPSPTLESAIIRATLHARNQLADLKSHYSGMHLLCLWLGEHPSLALDTVRDVLNLGFLINAKTVDDTWPALPDLDTAERLADAQVQSIELSAHELDDAVHTQYARAAAGTITIADIDAGYERTQGAIAAFDLQSDRFYRALCEQPWAPEFLAVLSPTHPWAEGGAVARRSPNAGMTRSSATEFLSQYVQRSAGKSVRDLSLVAIAESDPRYFDGDYAAYDAVIAAMAFLRSKRAL